jgi:pimeloyl-ACP methyl ester carboxylesterase
VIGAPSLETRMDDLRAVMDAAGSHRAALMAFSEGAALAILFAATCPERVAALALRSAYPRRMWAPDYPAPREQSRSPLQPFALLRSKRAYRRADLDKLFCHLPQRNERTKSGDHTSPTREFRVTFAHAGPGEKSPELSGERSAAGLRVTLSSASSGSRRTQAEAGQGVGGCCRAPAEAPKPRKRDDSAQGVWPGRSEGICHPLASLAPLMRGGGVDK